jgi:hypothetical protein
VRFIDSSITQLKAHGPSTTSDESEEEEEVPFALPTETKVESGTSQSKSGTSVNLSNGGNLPMGRAVLGSTVEEYLADKKTHSSFLLSSLELSDTRVYFRLMRILGS